MGDFDAIVVGAGIVGIAISRMLALGGRSVLLLDGEDAFGTWTSSRNSEVIHAGIYYPPGSNKARFCVEGKQRLYRYCAQHGVPHRRTGKLIFAAHGDQAGELEKIEQAAVGAGVSDLFWLSRADVRDREPKLDCAMALCSPSTGIVDSHALMLAMLGEAEAHGALFVPNSRAACIRYGAGLWSVELEHGEAIVSAPIVVNSAGLAAQALAMMTDTLDPAHVPPLHLARGVYFSYAGKAPFTHLIYPVPEPGGLGTHLTLDLAGQPRFGPDVEWIDRVDYRVDPARKDKFVAAARKIWPDLDAERLHPGYAGIRPKLSGPGEPAADFVISGPEDHGCPGLVNLFGIESPGLTSAMAIADHVGTLLAD